MAEFCSRVPTLCLSTVDEAGLPHAANLNFAATPDLRLIFVSHPDSAHSRHIARQPSVAAAAYAQFSSAAEIHGFQLHGLCRPLPETEFDEAFELFCARFTYARAYEARIRAEQFYRITPRWVRWIDNRRQFGFKIEHHWPPGPAEV